MDTTADCYMYAGARMIGAHIRGLLIVLGAGLRLAGAVIAARGPLQRSTGSRRGSALAL
jgi:hypothetical protein